MTELPPTNLTSNEAISRITQTVDVASARASVGVSEQKITNTGTDAGSELLRKHNT